MIKEIKPKGEVAKEAVKTENLKAKLMPPQIKCKQAWQRK